MGVYINSATSMASLMYGIEFDTATTALVNKTIEHAENEVNKYLSKRYDLSNLISTSTSIPPLARSLAENLCEGYSWQRMARGNKEWRDRGAELIEGAIDNLQAIADYELDLVNTAGSAIPDMSGTGQSILSNTENYTPTFNEDDELNWAVDSTKLDDISSSRD